MFQLTNNSDRFASNSQPPSIPRCHASSPTQRLKTISRQEY
ncbi:hypothetical protein [Geitlerinema sp. PCC 9228]|nr:hypothetical protein [Geitlerinema sp. PCC 9228]